LYRGAPLKIKIDAESGFAWQRNLPAIARLRRAGIWALHGF
jgi:hypothetical protein